MSASKERLQWAELPPRPRAEIEQLLASPVAAAENCAGGFSPGLAARLALADGRRAFVKAMDAAAWPAQAALHRAEAAVAAALPARLPVPRFLGSRDDGRWVILAFECIEGAEPAQPWHPADLDRALAAVARLAPAATPHARLGAPFIDLLTLLCSAAADGLDPEPFLRRQTLAVRAGPHAIDAVLAANAGYCLADALDSPPPGLEPVYAAKLALGQATLRWLERRLPTPR